MSYMCKKETFELFTKRQCALHFTNVNVNIIKKNHNNNMYRNGLCRAKELKRCLRQNKDLKHLFMFYSLVVLRSAVCRFV